MNYFTNSGGTCPFNVRYGFGMGEQNHSGAVVRGLSRMEKLPGPAPMAGVDPVH